MNNEYKWSRYKCSLIRKMNKLLRKKCSKGQFREHYARLSSIDGHHIITSWMRGIGYKRRIFFISNHELGLFTEVCYNV